jgi:lipoyl(octanoyl) transferase
LDGRVPSEAMAVAPHTPLLDLLEDGAALALRESRELVEYEAAMDEMAAMVERRRAAEAGDVLWLLSHPAVYTVGRRTPPEHRPSEALGIPVVETRRGGKLTYHSPGQVVGYVVVRLRERYDVVALIRRIEEVLVGVLDDLGIPAERRDTPEGGDLLTGVWTDAGRKIVSIGMRASAGVTSHGFAIDVDADLRPWTWAVPCGMPDVEMTSIAREREERGLPPVGQPEVRARIAAAFGAV